MKFLCDRCKTRYSIGDDRVRGKILKIRCKNCANVITVREGMTDVDASEPAPRRNPKPTTIAPPASGAAPTNGALGAAFATALTTKPPAALEEEWYLSDDGDQEGPFSLTQAQAWVGAKAFDADLHCWSEGFDDWLPVDKVSHFRGLRKKPAPAPAPQAPPPVPRPGASGGRGTAQSQAIEDEPKPLFAATMAALEKGSAPQNLDRGLGLPPATARATPAGGMPSLQARTNGAPSGAVRAPVSSPVKVPSSLPSSLPSAHPRPMSPRASTVPGVGTKGSGFDGSGDQPTQIEAPPFDDEAMTAAEPVAAAAKRTTSEVNDLFASAAARHTARDPKEDKETAPAVPRYPAGAPAPAFASATSPLVTDRDDDEDDELSIGEVSRVVKLADLMAAAPKQRSGPLPVANRTGPVPRMNTTGAIPRLGQTGMVPRLGQTGMVPRIDDPNAPPGEAPADLAPAPAVTMHHRRGLIMLIGVAAILLAGVAIAVVLLVFGGENITNTTLAGGDTIDTTRPDDPTRKLNPNDPGGGSAVNPFFPPKNPVKRPITNTNPNQNTGSNGKTEVELPSGSLRSDEIEEMARKHSSATQRCYMRSQKGAEQFMYENLKKIQATLTVGTDGAVKDVQLSQYGTSTLGKCLVSAIKSWKFRTSPGGLYKISLQFVAG